MAIRNVELGGTDWSDGEVLDAEDLNDTFDATINTVQKIHQIYTGTDFNQAESSSSSFDTTNSYEFTSISAANLVNADYLIIEVFGTSLLYASDSSIADAYLYFTVQTKEISGSYSDSLAETAVASVDQYERPGTTPFNFTYYHTLTAGEKANGVQLKLITRGVTGASSLRKVYLTNRQTLIKSIKDNV